MLYGDDVIRLQQIDLGNLEGTCRRSTRKSRRINDDKVHIRCPASIYHSSTTDDHLCEMSFRGYCTDKIEGISGIWDQFSREYFHPDRCRWANPRLPDIRIDQSNPPSALECVACDLPTQSSFTCVNIANHQNKRVLLEDIRDLHQVNRGIASVPQDHTQYAQS